MLKVLAGPAVLAFALALIGCGSETGDTTGDSTTTTVAAHALKMDVSLKGQGDMLAFLTPSNTIVDKPPADVVGKPYLFATFPAGFSPGNDPPLDYAWGEMPASLTVSYTTEAKYQDGPYDIVFVCYTNTPIPESTKDGVQAAPAAKGGDIASFSISTADIHEGDPKNALGTLRLNVAGADASVSIENRTPADPNNGDQTLAAFTNTVLSIP
jgi:hypothetical protein